MAVVDRIGLHYTDRCNAFCAHCAVHSGPRRREKMTLEEALDYVRQAAAIEGVGEVKLTGGEALLYPDEVVEVVRETTRLGLRASVVTNGYWAPTEEKGIAFLERLVEAGLAEVDFSADHYHWDYVRPAWVARAIRAAARLRLPRVIYRVIKRGERLDDPAFFEAYELDPEQILFVSSIESEAIPQAAEDLVAENLESGERTIVRVNMVSPAGRARALPDDVVTIAVENFEGYGCPEVIRSPVIFPDGTLYACCSGDYPDRLVVGNLNEASLEDLCRKMAGDAVLNTIRNQGVHRIHAELVARGYDLPGEYADICHLCQTVQRAASEADLEDVGSRCGVESFLQGLLCG